MITRFLALPALVAALLVPTTSGRAQTVPVVDGIPQPNSNCITATMAPDDPAIANWKANEPTNPTFVAWIHGKVVAITIDQIHAEYAKGNDIWPDKRWSWFCP